MRGKSHLKLGAYLTKHYMPHIPHCCVQAFLFGCIQPDKNPVTYLKGSVRHQWMRGHNYHNSIRFMKKLSSRLENRKKLSLLDYYALGKLIHYTADAFTLAHNHHFPKQLSQHRLYEIQLQEYFLNYLNNPSVEIRKERTIMDTIRICHREYTMQKPDIHTDASYTLSVSCSVLSFLFTSHNIMEC